MLTDGELCSIKIYSAVRVTANDYSYEGMLVSVFPKRKGAIRCVVEDGEGRLFIHNSSQISRIEPSDSAYKKTIEEIAVFLLNRDEGGGAVAWARNLLLSQKDSPHEGDCALAKEQKPYTCSRCVCDQALDDAADVYAISVPSPIFIKGYFSDQYEAGVRPAGFKGAVVTGLSPNSPTSQKKV